MTKQTSKSNKPSIPRPKYKIGDQVILTRDGTRILLIDDAEYDSDCNAWYYGLVDGLIHGDYVEICSEDFLDSDFNRLA